MPVVCPIRQESPSPSGARGHNRVPTELLGKTSSRLYWLAILVLVTSVVIFLSRHFLEPELRLLEKQLIFRIDMAVLVLASCSTLGVTGLVLFSRRNLSRRNLCYHVRSTPTTSAWVLVTRRNTVMVFLVSSPRQMFAER